MMMKGKSRVSMLILGICLLFLLQDPAQAQAPGLVHTDSGYDTVGGEDPICWVASPFRSSNYEATTNSSSSSSTQDAADGANVEVNNFEGRNWRSWIVPEFVAGATHMLQHCPAGMNIHMDLLNPDGKRLRQEQEYTYHVYASVNLTEVRAVYGLADDAFFAAASNESLFSLGPDLPQVALQLVFCPLTGNLCSPFTRQVRRRDQQVMDKNATFHMGELPTDTHPFLVGRPLLFPVTTLDSDTDLYEFQWELPLPFPWAGTYLSLASLQFFMDNGTDPFGSRDESSLLKFDMANLLHQRTQNFYAPMEIKTVTSEMEALTLALIAIAAVIQLALLGCTVYYRKEGVMKLSQGSFLVVLLVAGTMVTCCSVLFNPRSDLYCNLQGPMVAIPLQLMLAIVFGRLRRIIVIMAPLMDWHSPQSRYNSTSRLRGWKKTFMVESSTDTATTTSMTSNSEGSWTESGSQQTLNRPVRAWRKRKMKKLRVTYSSARLWSVVAGIMTPIVVLEIVGLVMFPPDLVLQANDDESIGRYQCGSNRDRLYQLSVVGVLIITLFLAMYEASLSRSLPALFNEAGSVSTALTGSLFITFLGLAVIIVTDNPETSPGIPYLFKVIIVCSMSLFLSVKIVLPKLLLVWKGEKVIMNKMLAEHKAKHAPKQETLSTPYTSANTNYTRPHPGDKVPHGNLSNSTFVPEREADGVGAGNEDSQHEPKDHVQPVTQLQHEEGVGNEPEDLMDDEAAEESAAPASPNTPGKLQKCASEPIVGRSDRKIAYANDHIDSSDAMEQGVRKSTTIKEDDFERANERKPMVIRSGHQPPSKLIMKALSHSNAAARINKRVLSGLQVDAKDWKDLGKSAEELHDLLANAVFFE